MIAPKQLIKQEEGAALRTTLPGVWPATAAATQGTPTHRWVHSSSPAVSACLSQGDKESALVRHPAPRGPIQTLMTHWTP